MKKLTIPYNDELFSQKKFFYRDLGEECPEEHGIYFIYLNPTYFAFESNNEIFHLLDVLHRVPEIFFQQPFVSTNSKHIQGYFSPVRGSIYEFEKQSSPTHLESNNETDSKEELLQSKESFATDSVTAEEIEEITDDINDDDKIDEIEELKKLSFSKIIELQKLYPLETIFPNLFSHFPPIRTGIATRQTLRKRLSQYKNSTLIKQQFNKLNENKQFVDFDNSIIEVLIPKNSEMKKELIYFYEKFYLNWQLPILNKKRGN